MVSNSADTIRFCFPDPSYAQEGKEAFWNAVTSSIEDNEEVGYAGMLEKGYLYDWLAHFIGEELSLYNPLSLDKQQKIQGAIENIAERSRELLPVPSSYVFLFPWLPEIDDFVDKMEGVNGVTPYLQTMHLYVLPRCYSLNAIKKTVAHEFNHIVFYHLQGLPNSSTLMDALVFDGLAELFEEDVIGEQSVVSGALEESKAQRELTRLFPEIETPTSFEEGSLYNHVFFGGGGYERWTGYAIGYHIVKSFKDNNADLSWEKIMQTSPQQIFEQSRFVQASRKGA